MGLDIYRVPPNEWLWWSLDEGGRKTLFRNLAASKLDRTGWNTPPSRAMHEFPSGYPSARVGSYSAYGVFILALEEMTEGLDIASFEQDEEPELAWLREFRREYGKRRKPIPNALHFLRMPDNAGSFLPAVFEKPFRVRGEWIASLPAAVGALEEFARLLRFDLSADPEVEYIKDRWVPLATMRNVARILHGFFTTDPTCVVMYL
jgi:hypothetical protein